ncbi:MAG: hypothetical protein GF381_01425 [Candidatus Pacebacteria bacterium]|nr:hypothetical protein [Candidatus Paceibacterota bacterium]
MAKNNDLTNQTQFGQESVLFEEQSEELAALEQPAENGKKKTNRLLIALVGGMFVLILALTAILLFVEPKDKKEPAQAEPTPTPAVEQTKSSLERQFDQLEQSLDQADPAKKELAFPQVKMDINLEQ